MEQKSNNDITPFAVTNFRNAARKFGIKLDDRRRHMYVIGKSGTGKSVLLENMIYTDIRAGHGLAVVDPHGDLVEKIIDLIPSHRLNDIVYFSPSDIDYPIAFNPLESVDPKYRHLVASGLVGVFKKIWADSWGPRLEYILRNAILSLLEYPSSTLLGITRILVDKYYRKKVVDKVTDPVVRSFWLDEYENYNEKFRTEAISPIQNKIGQFLSSSIIRNIVGQPKSTIDLRRIMDDHKVLLMDLSKGRVGEDNSALLGAMMITKIQLAAMSRIDTPETSRTDFFLYVDEFQNFATESFATILSEARKYRLNLIVAHQYIEQLGDVVKSAVFGNVGSMVIFRVGAEDAEFLEKEFSPTFTETDLVSLPNYHIYLKLMIDGVTSDAFSATTLPPVGIRTNNRDKIIKVSRERYAQSRTSVEEKILRWAGVEETFQQSAQLDSRALNPEEETYRRLPVSLTARNRRDSDELPRLNLTGENVQLFEDNCWVCGRKVQLPFKPDGMRPVYCKEDMKRVRLGLVPKPKPRLLVSDTAQPITSTANTAEAVEESPKPVTAPVVNEMQPAITQTVPVQSSAVKPVVDRPVKPKPIVGPSLHLADIMSQEPTTFHRRPPSPLSPLKPVNDQPKEPVSKPEVLKPKSVRPGEVIKFNG